MTIQTKAIKQYKEDMSLTGRIESSRGNYRAWKRFIYLNDQWENGAKAIRDGQRRPVVTINTSKQYIQQVANAQRSNPPQIEIIPIDGEEESVREAQIREDVARGIQRESNAEEAFIHGIEDAAAGGYGIVKLEPEYKAEDSNDQVLRIKRVLDASNCYLDPRSRKEDFSDMRFFIEHIPYTANQIDAVVNNADSKEIRAFMKDLKEKDFKLWGNKNSIVLINHWRVEFEHEVLYTMEDGDPKWASELDDKMTGIAKDSSGKPKNRMSYHRRVFWRRLMGDKLLSEVEWPGTTIPVGIFICQHIVLDDVNEFRGITPDLIDSQRIRNFARSNQVELMASAPKGKMVATLDSVPEELRPMWENAHTENNRMLYYQQWDDQGREQRPPFPVQAEGPSPALSEEVAITDAEMHQVTGRYEDIQGQISNATSGKAIGLKKDAGVQATIHVEHNGAVAMEYLGDCIQEVFPYYYDTPRRVLAVGRDGSSRMVTLNKPAKDEKGKEYHHQITESKFKCAVKIGPSYATKLLQSMEVMRDILQMVPAMGQARPDLVVKIAGQATGWNETQEWVESLKPLIPPIVQKHLDQMKNGGEQQQLPPQVIQEIQQMQQHIQEMGQVIQVASQHIEKLEDADAREWFKAETERIKADGQLKMDAVSALLKAHSDVETAHIDASKDHAANLLQLHGQMQQQQAQPPEPQPEGQPQ